MGSWPVDSQLKVMVWQHEKINQGQMPNLKKKKIQSFL